MFTTEDHINLKQEGGNITVVGTCHPCPPHTGQRRVCVLTGSEANLSVQRGETVRWLGVTKSTEKDRELKTYGKVEEKVACVLQVE